MRNPKRIIELTTLLSVAWELTPDQRLCQFLSNLVVVPNRIEKGLKDTDADSFFFSFEDDELEARLRRYIVANMPQRKSHESA